MVRLVSGVGQVTMAASSLEWALTYLTGLIDLWGDEQHRNVLQSPGRPLSEFTKLTVRLEALCGHSPSFTLVADGARLLCDDAKRLLAERNRVVHSVWLAQAATDGQLFYEAWHARSDTTTPVVPDELDALAKALVNCVAEAHGFAGAWKERATRDGWPAIPAIR
jgi:hypothetical protein